MPAQPDPTTLFPVADTQPKRCRHCNTTRKNLCSYDADIARAGYSAWMKRPRGCLNSAQNRDGIPY